MKFIILLSILVVVYCQPPAPPTPPKSFPAIWYTWVVTSVVKVGVDKPLYDIGQLISYDTQNQFTCRHLQQDLLNPSATRPVDYCDYKTGIHSSLSDVVWNQNCTSTYKFQGTLAPIAYPPEYLAVARFLGYDRVAQKNCSHFVAMNIVVDGVSLQLDVWTDIDTDYPCQISSTALATQTITTWAFDGFGPVIPQSALNQCGAAKIICTENDWVCNAIPTANPSALGSALGWVCDPSRLDCSPISPGGEHYLPNTLVDHCNWAFNAYFQKQRSTQGLSACNFGGVAQFVPPTSTSYVHTAASTPFTKFFPLTAMFTNDLVCEKPTTHWNTL